MKKIDFQEFVERKKKEFKGRIKFDSSDLSEKFIPYFESQERIEVKFSGEVEGNEIKRGTVGVTTGPKPVFILMLTKRSLGSSYILTNHDEILQVL